MNGESDASCVYGDDADGDTACMDEPANADDAGDASGGDAAAAGVTTLADDGVAAVMSRRRDEHGVCAPLDASPFGVHALHMRTSDCGCDRARPMDVRTMIASVGG
jgi:hypothetical protein